MTDPAPEPTRIASDHDNGAWWAIHSTTLMDMLDAVARGRSPQSVYVEHYNSSVADN